jgi:hypothetical protein
MDLIGNDGCCLMELDVEQNLSKPLTGIRGERPKRGRPFSLPDAELWKRRDQFAHMLGRFWGAVGWELQQAKRPDDIQTVFAQLRKFSDEILPFVHAPTRGTNGAQLRLRRKEVNECSEQLNHVSGAREKTRRALRIAETALQCRGTEEEIKVQSECQLRALRLHEIEEEHRRIAEKWERVHRCLEDEEGHFAQSELLDFIRSRRYSPTPENFGGAMAGLPFMSWRQSAIRCSQTPYAADSVAYEQFKAVEAALKTEGRVHAAARIHTWLASQSKAPYAVSELKKNWYYLSRAIADIEKTKQHPRRIAYCIVAKYQHNIQYSSATDVVIAETERIP